MTSKRNYTFIDKLCIHLDQAIKTVFGNPETTHRKYPSSDLVEPALSEKERKQSIRVMRVNHAGEVCAQALYHAQGLVSYRVEIRDKMQQAAMEEGDHLAWCQRRLNELGGHTSYLNPFWYIGSFAIGLTAGIMGDQWSLGFLAETENQVVNHLKNQLTLLPAEDEKSYKILLQMKDDENLHREDAIQSGARELPNFVKKGMQFSSGIMVKTTYWL